jgi:hypothetical protein
MTSVLIIFEMTGSYGLILSLMIVNMTAYALARHWRNPPVYEALLLQDDVTLPHGRPVMPIPRRLNRLVKFPTRSPAYVGPFHKQMRFSSATIPAE